jgi:hypothetical protein
LRPEPWSAEWFAVLIEKAREDRDELEHIETFLDRAEKLAGEDRRRLRAAIEHHLSTAVPSLKPGFPRLPNILHNTAAYDDPRTTVIFLGRRPDRIAPEAPGGGEEADTRGDFSETGDSLGLVSDLAHIARPLGWAI